jgi:sugar phosphate permease
MGFIGTCYQFGAAFAQLLAIFLTGYFVQKLSGDWRMVFLVPAVLFAVIGIFFYFSIRNKPEDVGLPPVDEQPGKTGVLSEASAGKSRSLRKNLSATLKNPNLWIVAFTFFFLDVNRYGFVNWLPAYVDIHSTLGDEVSADFLKKAMKICIHPLAGSLGVIVCGWATDRFFQGRRAPVIAMALFFLSIFSFLFVYTDLDNTPLLVFMVAMVGFFTYGAHILMVGHAAADFGRKEGSSGAAGFIDSMGYVGASLAGWGAGKLIVHFNKTDPLALHGYKVTFMLAGVCALVGTALICTIWKRRPQSD